MNDLLTFFNHLAATALEQGAGGGAAQVRSLVLDPEGMRLVLWLEHPLARGEAVLRLHTQPAEGGRQTLRVTVERAPDALGDLLEPFRRVLETARISIDLDFSQQDATP